MFHLQKSCSGVLRKRLYAGFCQRWSQTINRVGYITDVEGNLNYWDRCVALSSVLKRLPNGQLLLNDNCAFVFGGDCFDKGPGDIRISRELVKLKKSYPDRVFLILGNRDVNKMLLASALEPREVLRASTLVPPPFWLPEDSSMTLFNFVGSQVATKKQRLLYMLKCTMNSVKSFEFRRAELSILAKTPLTAVTDAQVVDSYFEGIANTDGFYREYIDSAQLAVCIGNTLFVHGAVTPESIGFVPSLKTRYKEQVIEGHDMLESSVQEWVGALNKFKVEAMAEFTKQPFYDDTRAFRGGEALCAYAHMKATSRRTVMVSSFISQASGNLEPVPASVVSYLNRSGITRVVVGHKPLSDSPTVIATPLLEVINGDTSFSDPSAADQRGLAHSEICIVGSEYVNQTQIHGVLKSGLRHAFALKLFRSHPTPPQSTPHSTDSCTYSTDSWPATHDFVKEDSLIGTQYPHCRDFWIQTCIPSQQKSLAYQVVKGEGFNVLTGLWNGT